MAISLDHEVTLRIFGFFSPCCSRGRSEIVLNLGFSQILMCPEGEILWHFVLISEIEKAYRPLWIAIETQDYIGLHLLHRLSISTIVSVWVDATLQVEFVYSVHLLGCTTHTSISWCYHWLKFLFYIKSTLVSFIFNIIFLDQVIV